MSLVYSSSIFMLKTRGITNVAQMSALISFLVFLESCTLVRSQTDEGKYNYTSNCLYIQKTCTLHYYRRASSNQEPSSNDLLKSETLERR